MALAGMNTLDLDSIIIKPKSEEDSNRIYTATPEDFNNNVEVEEIVESQQVIVEPVIEQQVPLTFNLKEEMKKLTPEELIEMYFGDEYDFSRVGSELIENINKFMYEKHTAITQKIMDEREVVKFSDFI